MSLIGIKLANGDFYPILTEESKQKKRIILTTATVNQTSVQIDFYRSPSASMQEAHYIGTIVLDGLKPKPSGEASLEMVAFYDLSDLSVCVRDMDDPSIEKQYLSVSIKSLNENSGKYEIDGIFDEGVDFSPESVKQPSVEENVKVKVKKAASREGKSVLGVILIIIAAVILISGAVWFFVLGGEKLFFSDGEDSQSQASVLSYTEPIVINSPPPQAQNANSEPAQEVARAAAETPVKEDPVSAPPPPEPAKKQSAEERKRPLSPVGSYKVPSPIPAEGVWYTVRWGDTLWAISEAFYRDPWSYRFLARYNGIKNPSRIISGSRIKIPPRR
jgi:hypothetical protein